MEVQNIFENNPTQIQKDLISSFSSNNNNPITSNNKETHPNPKDPTRLFLQKHTSLSATGRKWSPAPPASASPRPSHGTSIETGAGQRLDHSQTRHVWDCHRTAEKRPGVVEVGVNVGISYMAYRLSVWDNRTPWRRPCLLFGKCFSFGNVPLPC